jgi:hypothetical protein
MAGPAGGTTSRSAMTKTNDLIAEVIKDAKHPFRALINRPKKAQKNRYERRKVKEYLRDWSVEESFA